jgi:hypothetical protein
LRHSTFTLPTMMEQSANRLSRSSCVAKVKVPASPWHRHGHRGSGLRAHTYGPSPLAGVHGLAAVAHELQLSHMATSSSRMFGDDALGLLAC